MTGPYYITKYALTTGIIEVPHDLGEVDDGYLSYKPADGYRVQVGKKDWFTDLAKALIHVGHMREARIKSLQKQIHKLTTSKNPKITVVK